MSDRNALIQPDKRQPAIAIRLIAKSGLDEFLRGLSAPQRAAVAAQKFEGDGYSFAIVPEGDGWFVVAGVADPASLSSWCMAKLAEVLPAGTYRREGGEPGPALLGWATGQYRFDRYRSEPKAEGPRVLLTGDVSAIPGALAEAAATALVRDLVNTPAEDMGPAELEAAAERIARAHSGELRITRGDALEHGFPMVHRVGRAAARSHAPRMIEIEWGDPAHPRIAIVGKGVCFDSGGLDIKPSSGMLLMKKDMGGAAAAIAAARMIMQAKLKVRLRLLVPAVENAVSGSSFRPGDVLRSRKGLTVEIGNTDAEGRLILADALALADEEAPELLIDYATLTGAARVALGPDLPPFYTHDDGLAAEIARLGAAVNDPVWRMPLWPPYDGMLDSKIADINNVSGGAFAGSVTAALFLNRFVEKSRSYAHFDIYGWNPSTKPGRPEGGECQAARLTYALAKQLYGSR